MDASTTTPHIKGNMNKTLTTIAILLPLAASAQGVYPQQYGGVPQQYNMPQQYAPTMHNSGIQMTSSGYQQPIQTVPAQVVSSQPQFRQVMQPQQRCELETTVPQSQSNAPAIVGGLAGAALGNTVGKGNGKVAATVIGGVVGAIASERQYNQPQQYQRCTTEMIPISVPAGFLVTYEVNGQQYQQMMPRDPGQQVMLAIRAY